ncbi:MAG: D-alanyl-D-alanine carboxypeptidase/D-alanyl-D-alanine-endopeptidase [Piscinibacter sp.]|uniref:D-alanyl-D-alanine carboxypeptidase/D-alanyl-D-alanine endopeptidase n=1 Tax=Piscinibacter sp. TaxID=1903157 RepID=UPI00258F4271|nr:D-alanyl-D-alanine carboxypeptidase/D-alanyl-D-alanine-endopeptidase [Piscinibacter sp.]MCW5667642.1 D-alanyl-D-alanine carboxypeptidase/D-alanyl-D-alanine-endopeptidase [Piscinibacter sp.]
MGLPWIRRVLAVFGATFCTVAAARLPPEVLAALERARVPPEALSVVVQEAGSSRTRLAWQAEQAQNPASLTKLWTTYAALDLLGPGWTWSTPVWLHGSVADGVLRGDLVIKGQGDPKLVPERLWLLLRRVQALGVREIQGDIVLDRSAFGVPEQAPGDFDGEPLRPYNVRADALLLAYRSVILSFTPDAARGVALVGVEPTLAGVAAPASVPLSGGPCADWRGELKAEFGDAQRVRLGGSFPLACGEKQWPLAYADPRRYDERLLTGLWRELGGRLAGTVRDGPAPATAPSFTLVSPPLAEVVREINKFSNNVMAQQLFLTLGLVRGTAGTPDAAREVLRRWLAERLGARAAEGAVLDNGSGLSRETRLSAQQLARLLQSAWASPVMPELLASLPVSGTDGTLLRSRAPAGRAHLKTGSLRDVAGVAGFVLSASGRRYVLVAVVNHANAAAARPALDALVQWAITEPLASGAPLDSQN